jgi:hypothetical protein
MGAHKLPDVVLDFKSRMHDRPVVRRSDEGKKRQKILEAPAAQRFSQQRLGALGLQRLDKNHSRSREYPIFQVACGSGPVDRFLDCRQACINRLELSLPRRGCSQQNKDFFDLLRARRRVARRMAAANQKSAVTNDAVTHRAEAGERKTNSRSLKSDGMGLSR